MRLAVIEDEEDREERLDSDARPSNEKELDMIGQLRKLIDENREARA